MNKAKRITSIILTAVMMLSVFVVAPVTASAYEYTGGVKPEYSEPEETELTKATISKNTVTHDNFEILSPTAAEKFTVKKSIPIEIKRVYSRYVWGAADWVVVEIQKDEVLIKRCVIGIQDHMIGTTFKDSFTPDEAGTYTVHVGFAGGRSTEPEKVDDNNYLGSYTFKVLKTNTIAVKTATKSVKASALKKAKKTVKPLTISNANGTVKVTKVKNGTSAKIYSKITVAKKTGAINFKKGAYKKGTYKVKLKITAAGNSSYNSKTMTKSVKIKIK